MRSLDASFRRPDKRQLRRVIIEELHGFFPDLGDQQTSRIADGAIERAGLWDIGETEAVLDFARLMVSIATQFDEHPRVRQVLSNPAVPPDSRPRLLCEVLGPDDWREAAKFGERVKTAGDLGNVQEAVSRILSWANMERLPDSD